MSVVRSRNRLIVTRPSARASGLPHSVDAVPEGDVLPGVRTVDVELVRVLEHPGITVAGTGHEHDRPPAGMSTPASLVAHACHPELRPQRALEPKHLLNEVGDAVTVLTDEFLEVGPLAEHPSAKDRSRTVVS